MYLGNILLAGAILLAGCKGAKDRDEEGSEPFEPLPVAKGEFEIQDSDLVEDSCDLNIDDDLEDLDIKFDQVETGLSIFFDPDIGWIPCDGSLDLFRCEWGNAPADTTDSRWIWVLQGMAAGGLVQATLTLTVTCDPDANRCEPCTMVQEFNGALDQ